MKTDLFENKASRVGKFGNASWMVYSVDGQAQSFSKTQSVLNGHMISDLARTKSNVDPRHLLRFEAVFSFHILCIIYTD